MNKRKQFLLAGLLFILILAAVGPVAAQEKASATLAPVDPAASYTVGDPVLLTLTVQHPAGTQLIVPDLPESWGDFTIAAVGLPESTASTAGQKTTTLAIDARLFAPGEFFTPALTVQLADANGQLSSLEVTSLAVTVQSVLVAGDTALRDIKPPAELPGGNVWLLFFSGLMLGTASAGAAIWWWRSNRAQPLPVDNRPAYVIAQEALDQLAGQNLPEQRQFKAYYTTLSDILRWYLARAYGLAIREQTTTEIDQSLRHVHLSKGVRERTIAILHTCDLVKFADAPSSPVEAAALLAETREMIQALHHSLLPATNAQATVTQPAITMSAMQAAQMEVRS